MWLDFQAGMKCEIKHLKKIIVYLHSDKTANHFKSELKSP